MEIIKGKIASAKKVVIYGPEGIGKSTFASRFPEPVFIDTEGSTKDMDVSRFPKATSWTMLKEQLIYVKTNPSVCRTLVIDTVDWAEQLCVEFILNKYQKSGIEEFGYGNGYVYVKEEFGRFLNFLQDIVDAGVHVVLTAHAQMRKFEQPDEMGAYDRYELKLGKKTSSQTSPLVKEWSDMLLFVNYKTYSVAADRDGKKHKAQGGTRTMYTTHHPCWDAKNRYGLPEEVVFDYQSIAHIIENTGSRAHVTEKPATVSESRTPVTETSASENTSESKAPVMEEPAKGVPACDPPVMEKEAAEKKVVKVEIDPNIPKSLRDLMELHDVSEWDIQEVVGAKGYYPSDTPVTSYAPEFIEGCLVGAWDTVYGMIEQMRDTMQIPFETN